MSKKVVVFGTSEFSCMLAEYIGESDDSVCAFCVDREYLDASSQNGLPVIPFEDLPSHFLPGKVEVLVALGYRNMNALRKQRMEQALAMGYTLYTYIHPSAIISIGVCGSGNIFLENVVIAKGVKIGTGNIFQISTSIAHHTTIGNYNFFAPCCHLAGDIHVGDNCFFGINSSIVNGVFVSDYTLCGAGSLLTQDTLPYEAIVPARGSVFNKTSIEIDLLSH